MTRTDNPEKHLKKLTTGFKTFVLLGLALLPLGIVAILSSIEAAHGARDSRYAEVNILAEVGARYLSTAISNTDFRLQSTVTEISESTDPLANCQSTVDAVAAIENRPPHFAIFQSNGDLLCATEGTSAEIGEILADQTTSGVVLNTDRDSIILIHASADRRLIGVAELSRRQLTLLPQAHLLERNLQITLSQGNETLLVRPWDHIVPDDDILSAAQPVKRTDFVLKASFERAPLNSSELIAIALPILMWAAGALLGWMAISLLLIRPLAQLRHAVLRHASDGTEFEIPELSISAIEIQQLAQAFEKTFETVRSHEEQLAESLKEQTRLTREVHHRVKNNLQIIASLLNLHARAAKSDDSAAAYASIQRRVDALAIVQRNLFSELESEAGILIRPVVAELASGLQQSAPSTTEIAITLDVDPIRVGQDIAAPAAFLITELVELAMLSSDHVEIAIAVQALPNQCARLSVRSAALAMASERAEFPRYRRVLTGLARQIQASLDEDDSRTLFTIMIPILSTIPENHLT